MEGPLIPYEMAPRFTTLMMDGIWTTEPGDVEAFGKVTLTLWRSPMPGTSPTFEAWLEDSHDAVTWTPLHGSAIDPSTATTVRYDLLRRWLRLRVELGGSDVAATFWCVGNLERRVE
jgi:hypothetical protein